MTQKLLSKLSLMSGLLITMNTSTSAQNCDLTVTENRRTQIVNMTKPHSYIVQMTMKRGKNYNGTAFLIHPRVLLTAGHNLRKRNSIFTTRVKGLTLRFGATNKTSNLFKTYLPTTQFNNIYTHPGFNADYSIGKDYGIIILPDDEAYKIVGGHFKLTVCDTTSLKNKIIHIGSYPGDRPFCTQWQDSTSNYFFYKNYLHYDFSTEHGASGAPIWYTLNNELGVFAIHTNGDGFDQYKCNTATLITKEVYEDIVRFCSSKGIDITK